MTNIKIKPMWIVAAVAVVGVYVWRRCAAGVGADIGRVSVNVVDGVLTGTVKAAGGIVGIPDTNFSACEMAKKEGRTWDASFACSAGDFLKYMVGK